MHDDLAKHFAEMRAYLRGEVSARDFLNDPDGANAAGSDSTRRGEGMALYRWLVLADRRALLEEATPLARAFCEPDVWSLLTEQYVAEVPTLEWDTVKYADGFPAFLASKSDAGELPRYIPELAELSLLRRRAFLTQVEPGRAVLDETVFVRLFSHDVRVAPSPCGTTREVGPKPAARPCVVVVYRCCASGQVRQLDGTAARVIALLDALAQPVVEAMRDSVPESARAAALLELRQAGVLPTDESPA